MFGTSKKVVLPAEKISNAVYIFTCACGHRYIGKTIQQLEERVKQHVPNESVMHVTEPDSSTTMKRRLGRPRNNAGKQKLNAGNVASAKSGTSVMIH